MAVDIVSTTHGCPRLGGGSATSPGGVVSTSKFEKLVCTPRGLRAHFSTGGRDFIGALSITQFGADTARSAWRAWPAGSPPAPAGADSSHYRRSRPLSVVVSSLPNTRVRHANTCSLAAFARRNTRSSTCEHVFVWRPSRVGTRVRLAAPNARSYQSRSYERTFVSPHVVCRPKERLKEHVFV